MEQCLHRWFVLDNQLHSSCDFHAGLLAWDASVYEVIRLVDGKPLFLKEHLRRLVRSQQLAFSFVPYHNALVIDSIKMLIESNAVGIGNFKVVVGQHSQPNSYVLAAWFIPYSYPSDELYRKGVKVSLFNYVRQHPPVKLLDVSYKMAVEEAIRKTGSYEILLNHDGRITEGSRSNVFFVRNGAFVTAPDDLVLAGITREKLLQIIRQNEIPLHLEALHTKELNNVEAAFLCGTSPKVIHISNIDDAVFLKLPHPLIQWLAAEYDKLIAEDVLAFAWPATSARG